MLKAIKWVKVHHGNTNQEKSGIIILISEGLPILSFLHSIQWGVSFLVSWFFFFFQPGIHCLKKSQKYIIFDYWKLMSVYSALLTSIFLQGLETMRNYLKVLLWCLPLWNLISEKKMWFVYLIFFLKKILFYTLFICYV